MHKVELTQQEAGSLNTAANDFCQRCKHVAHTPGICDCDCHPEGSPAWQYKRGYAPRLGGLEFTVIGGTK